MINRPEVFNTIGFYCWHQYDTNPALIEVYWRGGDSNESWKIMSKMRLEMVKFDEMIERWMAGR